MNIIDMERRKDAVVEFHGMISRIGQTFGDKRYNGYRLEPGASIRIQDVLKWVTFRHFPHDCSYFHRSEAKKQFISVDIRKHGIEDPVLSSSRSECSRELQLVTIQWPLICDATSLDLTICSEPSNQQPVELYIFENINHDLLCQICRGKGVEMGPGNNPRLMPNTERTVDYIEACAFNEWYQKQNKNKEDHGLWHLYTIAKAHELPYLETSLDFIFGSHVFEHLINPLGHLERWGKLLKAGGIVALIVPNIRGCFEYRSWPTCVNEWVADYNQGIFEPTLKHYEPYCSYHGCDPSINYQKAKSAHFSFFDEKNLSWMVNYACKYLGYSSYSMQWSPNHFDVSFVLKK